MLSVEYNSPPVIMQVAPNFGCSITAPCECCDPHLNCRLNVSEVWSDRVHLTEAGEILQSGCGYMRVSTCAPLPLMEQFSAFPAGLGSSTDLTNVANRQSSVNSTGVAGNRSQISEPEVYSLASQVFSDHSVASPSSVALSGESRRRTILSDILDGGNASAVAQQAEDTPSYSSLGDELVVEPGSVSEDEFRQPPFVAANMAGLEPNTYYAGGSAAHCCSCVLCHVYTDKITCM